jgi:glutathione reductase (NADPH)
VVDRLLQISLMKGIEFRFNAEFESIEKTDTGCLKVAMTGHEDMEVDCVMFATGRIPNTRGLGLENAGVELGKRGEVMVDRFSRTNVESIYAVGDVTNRVQLTPVAVFSHPPIASVGMTESEARNTLGSVKIYSSDFRAMKNVVAGRNERSLYKMICDGENERIVGMHMIGPDAPEIMQAAAVAVKARLTKADFDATIAIHPTMAEELVLMR